MPAIGAKGKVARLHRRGKPRGHRLLAEREVARSLDQILQEEIESALLALADLQLQAVHRQPLLLANVVVKPAPRSIRSAHRFFRHGLSLDAGRCEARRAALSKISPTHEAEATARAKYRFRHFFPSSARSRWRM